MAGPPPADPRPPLLLVCALGIERFALRGALRRAGASGSDPDVAVLSTGMGPRAATESVRGALRGQPRTTVLGTGFCAGLAPGILPGDVVVAAEVRDASEVNGGAAVPCPEAEALARALRARGLRVHVGPLASTDHVVRGKERAALHSTGAVAVDMESAAALSTALSVGNRTVAAARVVVDTPEHELARLGTLRTGITAYRHLRAAVPAFIDWHRIPAGTEPALTKHHPLSPEVS
jgi:nucleoside phosphorylase